MQSTLMRQFYIPISAASNSDLVSNSTPVVCIYIYRTYLFCSIFGVDKVPSLLKYPSHVVSQFTTDKPSGTGFTLYSCDILSAYSVPRRHVLLHTAVEAGFFASG